MTAGATGIEAQVCEDIERRQQLGIAKYGQTVAENPAELRDWLQHAYEEALDLAIYLKRARVELNALAGQLPRPDFSMEWEERAREVEEFRQRDKEHRDETGQPCGLEI